MSLEQKIDNLVSVIEKLVIAIESRNVQAPAPVAAVVAAPAPVVEHVVSSVEPVKTVVAEPKPAVEPPQKPVEQPAMPPLPTFAMPAEPPKPAAPFNDPRGMIQYVTDAYRAMGPEKGAKIQNVISGLGVQNINDIQVDHYGALFAGIEALKNGA